MNFAWDVFWSALVDPVFLRAAGISALLALLALLVSLVISVPMALGLQSRSWLLRGAIRGYVGFFRAIPTLLQLFFFWNALPEFHPMFRESWYTPFLAALISFSINEAAYQVEINRAALSSVDRQQLAAARAFGFGRLQTFFLIALPQAARVAIPPTVNEYITLLKATSLASVISLQELMTVTNQAVSSTFLFKEYYLAAAVYYLVIVGLLTGWQGRLERRFDWGRAAQPDALSRLGGLFAGRR